MIILMIGICFMRSCIHIDTVKNNRQSRFGKQVFFTRMNVPIYRMVVKYEYLDRPHFRFELV